MGGSVMNYGGKSKKSKSKSKKPMNAFMMALSKARAANADSFVYNGKTYYKKLAKTGIPLYSSTKSGGSNFNTGGMCGACEGNKKHKKTGGRSKSKRRSKSRSKSRSKRKSKRKSKK